MFIPFFSINCDRRLSLVVLLLCAQLLLAIADSCAQIATTLDCTAKRNGPARGVVLLAHGLNQHPDTMAPMQMVLSHAGFSVCLLRLAGHRPTDECSYQTPQTVWQEQYEAAFKSLSVLYPDIPKHAVGYSLGAALTTWFVNSQPQLPFQRIVLLAPPFGLRTKTQLIRLFLPLRHIGAGLPSAAPEQYRFCSSTKLSAYFAAVRLVDSLERVDSRLDMLPTRIFIRENDDLNDLGKLQSWLSANNLNTWRLTAFPSSPAGHPLPAHVVIDEPSLGPSLWRQMTEEIVEFLAGDKDRPVQFQPKRRSAGVGEER